MRMMITARSTSKCRERIKEWTGQAFKEVLYTAASYTLMAFEPKRDLHPKMIDIMQ